MIDQIVSLMEKRGAVIQEHQDYPGKQNNSFPSQAWYWEYRQRTGNLRRSSELAAIDWVFCHQTDPTVGIPTKVVESAWKRAREISSQAGQAKS